MFNINFCWWLDSNRGPLESEATALPTNSLPTIFNLLSLIVIPDCTPESIFSSRAEHQVDLQRKLQEDPLITLKKKELDTRKKILDNPIKMKQIQSYVSACQRQLLRRLLTQYDQFELFLFRPGDKFLF